MRRFPILSELWFKTSFTEYGGPPSKSPTVPSLHRFAPNDLTVYEMVRLIKSRRPNSRRNSSDFYIPCLPPNRWMHVLLEISLAFWYGKTVKEKLKFSFQRANCSEPNKLVVVRVLLRCQQGQWTTLLVNCVQCLSILDEGESGMNSWVLAIQPRTPQAVLDVYSWGTSSSKGYP